LLFCFSDMGWISNLSSFLSSSSSIDRKLKQQNSVILRLLFQAVFTLVLLGVWLVLLAIYLQFLPPRGPRNYPTTLTPGLSFRPRPDNPKSTLIHFTHGGSGNWRPLVKRFKSFLKEYSKGKTAGVWNLQKCNYNTPPLEPDQRCGVSGKKWIDFSYDTPCTKPEGYGMFHGQPCLIVKLNKVFGWQPEPYYNITEVAEHPRMPQQMKDKIQGTWEKHCKGGDKEDRCPQLRMVWLSCEGETEADKEWLGGVTYTPWQGFPGFYYPYHAQDHYVSPLVWIQLRSITPGVLIQIRCRAWAKNIEHSERNHELGGVHMELMMD